MATEWALAIQSRRSIPEQVMNANRTWPVTTCVDCDEAIPTGRLALGKIRCVACQTDKESREKRGLK
jgi:RNA polymerase-binding transcription factor DksA